MKSFKRILTLFFIAIIVVTLVGCDIDEENPNNNPPVFDLGEIPTLKPEINGGPNNSDYTWGDLKPNIIITEIGQEKPNDEVIKLASDEADVQNLVYTFVASKLSAAGFDTSYGVAIPIDERDKSTYGVYYYSDEIDIFADEDIKAVGFVEVTDHKEKHQSLDDFDEVVIADYIEDNDNIYLLSYVYEEIGYGHFVYQNEYVKYYQQSDFNVVYDIYDNVKSNYDLNYGSLYDYDNNMYIYDESILNDYKNHSGIELFEKEDYAKLEAELQAFSEEQLANGYIVEEYQIVYISPESIQTYLSSEETDTFFGYKVSDLTKEFGIDTALEFNGLGFNTVDILMPEDEYNWKSFLTKVGIGSGIILAGAILSPITGGASFSCAILTISKVAFSYGLTAGLGTLAIETVSGLLQGMSIKESLEQATYKGLDNFANAFIIGAAVGTIGVLSGSIKPEACFLPGTLILIDNINNNYKNIEDLRVGDIVYSYNEETKSFGYNKVTELFINKVSTIIEINLGYETIYASEEHPFYLEEYDVWVSAISLKQGDVLKDSNNKRVTIQNVEVKELDEEVEVYNFSVENDHTYFVGESKVLVHNTCKPTAKELRDDMNSQKYQRDAVKNEIEAIRNGTSKKKYPSDLIAAIQDQTKTLAQVQKEYAGEFAAHHLIPVSQIIEADLDYSLVTDPDNILVMLKDDHKNLHSAFGGYKNAANLVNPESAKMVVKFAGTRAAQIYKLFKASGLI